MLLSSLSPAYHDSLLARLKPIHIPIRTQLYTEDETPKFAHFITSGIASVVSSMASGATAEVGIWGHEGLAQSFHLLGKAHVPNNCFVQMEATALVMPFSELEREFQINEELRRKILQCVQSQGVIVGQLAACNRLHEAGQRLARWLLMVRDRVDAGSYHLTQEFLANMLGARRTTVTAAAGDLQRRGLIEYMRGNIRITDGGGLERASCECYGVIKQLYSNFYMQG